MKQSTTGNTHFTHSALTSYFSDDEIEIADVLLNLPYLIAGHESGYRFSVRWGQKRRRSVIDSTPSPSPSPSLQVERESEKRLKIKAEAASPTTPLSFSPSESDDKSKQSGKKVSRKRTREEWMGIIDELIQSRELLREEIETVKSHYNKLKMVNLELKAKKQGQDFCLTSPHLEISKSLNLGMKLNLPIIQSTTMIQNQEYPQIHRMVHHQPYIADQTAYGSHSSGPLCIPDLNVAPEETFGQDAPQPLDLRRALTDPRAKAAEARRKRMLRIREMKNSVVVVKPPRC